MRIRAGYEITYDCSFPTPMMLMLSIRPERLADLLTPQILQVSRDVPVREYVDGFGNVCHRLLAPEGRIVFSTEFQIEDDGLPDPEALDAVQHPVEQLPDDVLVYLLASRYCDTDLLSDFAWAEFGSVPAGWRRVQAIVDYTHAQIAFGYEHASVARTAYGAHVDRRGVCRDYAHLAVTLCRCLNVPARYCTGYLGDIGVPAMAGPMDFSAWFEVYLGGAWHTFDARWNQRRIGRTLQAYGRDAVDVAIATTFGAGTLTGFEVITEELP